MTKVVLEISMSLDGFIAGADFSPEVLECVQTPAAIHLNYKVVR